MNITKILETENLIELFSEDELELLGGELVDAFKRDEVSRQGWMDKNAEAFKLALQLKEEKTHPWPKASNVKYPLITTACLQFNARAYPALIPNDEIIECKPIGKDPDGSKQQRCDRVASYMNHQFVDEIEDWVEGQDRLLMQLPLIGNVFKKSWFDQQLDRIRSEIISAENLVLDYNAKSINSCRRKTHVVQHPADEIVSMQCFGIYRDFDLPDPQKHKTELKEVSDEVHGLKESVEDLEYTVLEMHVWQDFDKDGKEEPYIIDVLNTGQVLRIIKRFDESSIVKGKNGRIAKIHSKEFFTKYTLIPSPDGAMYDLGLGVLLGPINHSVDTIMNQLIDAGTLANMQGGLLARSIRTKMGRVGLVPGKWINTSATSEQLRDGVFPWPLKEPSQTLLQLLYMLIDAGQQVGSVNDAMLGKNPGQNTAEAVSDQMLAQGMQVFGAIHKRTYRSLKEESRKIYLLLKEYINPPDYMRFTAVQDINVVQDFKYGVGKDIKPVADPNIITPKQRIQAAQVLRESVQQSPHLYGHEGEVEAEKRWLKALAIEDVEKLLSNPQPPSNPKLELDQKRLELETQTSQREQDREDKKTDSNMQKDEANTVRAVYGIKQAQTEQELAKLRLVFETALKEKELEINARRNKEGRT